MNSSFNNLLNAIFDLKEEHWAIIDKHSNEYCIREAVLNRSIDKNIKILESVMSKKYVDYLCMHYGILDGECKSYSEMSSIYSLSRSRLQIANSNLIEKLRKPEILMTLFYGIENPKTPLESLRLSPSSYTFLAERGIKNAQEAKNFQHLLNEKDRDIIIDANSKNYSELDISYLGLSKKAKFVLRNYFGIKTIDELIKNYNEGKLSSYNLDYCIGCTQKIKREIMGLIKDMSEVYKSIKPKSKYAGHVEIKDLEKRVCRVLSALGIENFKDLMEQYRKGLITYEKLMSIYGSRIGTSNKILRLIQKIRYGNPASEQEVEEIKKYINAENAEVCVLKDGKNFIVYKFQQKPCELIYLSLSTRAFNILKSLGYKTIKEVVDAYESNELTHEKIVSIKGAGTAIANEIKNAIENYKSKQSDQEQEDEL